MSVLRINNLPLFFICKYFMRYNDYGHVVKPHGGMQAIPVNHYFFSKYL